MGYIRYIMEMLHGNISGMDFLAWRFYFILFFIVGLFWLIPPKYRKGLMLIISLAFYLLNGKRAITLLIYVIISSWITAVLLEKHRSKKLLWFGIAMIALPFILNRTFLIDIDIFANIRTLLSCMGLAYTTMMAIGYVIDIYMERYSHIRFVNYTAFLSFFPYALSGPIERADHMNDQIEALEKKRFSWGELQAGAICIIYGLFVKLVMADRIGILVNTVLDDYQNYVGLELVTAIVLYAAEIYFDFSACSNVARGIARCFGVEVINNFEQPYFAKSVGEFWRRWHRSLSFWLRDYIYIPLGGSKKGKCRQYLNLLLTFVVSGLWHGFSPHYILWGGINGVYQIVEKSTLHIRQKINDRCGIDSDTMGHQVMQVFLTFVLIDFSHIFFRVGHISDAFKIVKRIVMGMDWSFVYSGYLNLGLSRLDWSVIAVGFLVITLVDILHYKYKEQFMNLFLHENLGVRYFVFIGLFIATVVFGTYGAGFDSATFIYRGF